jgi:hypothetical protein
MFWRDASFGERSTTPVTTDADAFVASIRQRHETSVTVHHGHNPEITFTGERSADGIWSLYDWVDNPVEGHAWQGYGHYIEEYLLEDDGQWRIHRMRLARVRIVPLPASAPGTIQDVNRAWQAGTLILGHPSN